MSFLCLKTLDIQLFYWKLDFFYKLILMIGKKLNIGSDDWSTLIINVVKHTLKAYMCMYI